jgi:DNA-binding NarL/FixJ family response regulator
VTRGVLDRIHRGKHLQGDRRLALLSAQEERVLTEASAGKTNRQIAESLQLAEKSVKNYVSSILGKLEVSRRAEAATYLVRYTSLSG